MDSKYCSSCLQKRLLSCFSTTSTGKVLATCNSCRAKKNNKRKALQELDPNLPSKRCATGSKTPTNAPSTLKARPNPLPVLELCLVAPCILRSRLIPPSIPESRNPPSILELRPNPTSLLESRPVGPSVSEPRPIPQPPQLPLTQPENGFLSAEQWRWVQNFNKKMADIKMETCTRCKECWFSMGLKDNICQDCF